MQDKQLDRQIAQQIIASTGKSYAEKLEAFRALVEKHTLSRTTRLGGPLAKFAVEQGYKFDKVYGVEPTGTRFGKYMVESRTGNIYGIKSWTQVNRRRLFGNLDSVDQFDWSDWGRPLPNTQAEREIVEREKQIKLTHKKRGRKPNAVKLSKGK